VGGDSTGIRKISCFLNTQWVSNLSNRTRDSFHFESCLARFVAAKFRRQSLPNCQANLKLDRIDHFPMDIAKEP
jgi:hypothetical protein